MRKMNANIKFDNVEELQPVKDSRQSFYGKALVERSAAWTMLYSYFQMVCWIIHFKDEYEYFLNGKVDEQYLLSTTTLRHIKEFLYQELGLENLTKSELKSHIVKE